MDEAPGATTGRFDCARRRRKVAVRTLVGFGAAALVLGLMLQLLVAPSPWVGPSSNQSFTLVQSNEFAPSSCAVVTLSWESTDGRSVSVSLGQGAEATFVSHCRGSGPENFSCPALLPPPGTISMGPGPFYCQTGTEGSLRFTATQPSYVVFENGANTKVPANDPVRVHLGYAAPLIPASATVPVLIGSLVGSAGAIASAVAVAATTLQISRSSNRG